MSLTRSPSSRLTAFLGVALGALAGISLVALGGASASRPGDPTGGRPPAIEVAHRPPLLTAPGERVELGYDAYCLPAAESADVAVSCEPTGSVFVRASDREPYVEIPLRVDPARTEGKLVAAVPGGIARSPGGFSYYAVIEDRATGASTTLPAGGADAPQRSLPLGRPVEVALGAHRFGATRSASARVADARWGHGPGDVGLEQGRSLPPIGGASFDVAADGSVLVLDQANRRVLRWARGRVTPDAIPLVVNGTIADLAIADDRLYVLETAGAAGRPSSLLRAFARDGRPVGTQALGEPAYRLRLGPEKTPVALQQTSGQWVRVGTGGGRLATLAEQRASGRVGRPLPGGGEVVLLRTAGEIRVAVTGPGGARHAWRVTSDTPLAEVQLAEPLGSRLVLVARVYTDARDEFLVLVLGARGVEAKFSVPSSDWAETAPLSRFRLAGSSLYQLGSTSAGPFVDRYDLEVE